MADDDEVDIYGGLPDYDFDKRQKELELANQNLRRRVKVLECENHALKSENKKLAKRESSLNRNISVLYATALAELEFKNKALADLTREKDSILFRRSVKGRSESRPNLVQPEESASLPNVSLEASEAFRKSKDKKLEEKSEERGRVRQRKTRPPSSAQEEQRVLRSGDRGRRPQRKSEERELKPVKKPQSLKKMPVKKSQSPKKMPSSLKTKAKDTNRKEVESSDSKKQSAERLLETLNGPDTSSIKENTSEPSSAPTEQPESVEKPEDIVPEKLVPVVKSVPKSAKTRRSSAKVPDLENHLGERHSDTSIESHASSTKENSKESRILRAERMHKEKQGDSPISLTTEIKRIPPRKKQILDSSQNKSEDGDGDSNYSDLLSSLLESEKERINPKSTKKKKKKVAVEVSTKDNPETPGKFLIEGSMSESVPQPDVVQNDSPSEKSLSPALLGPPETPGKYLVGHMSLQMENSPTKSSERKQKELDSAVFSILPTPLKLMAQNPLLLSPLQATPVCTGPPQINKTPEETVVANPELPQQITPTTPPATQHVSPNQSFNASIASTNSTQLMIDLSRTGETPIAAPPVTSFPFKRKRVLKIKCISTGNSSLEESKDTSVEEPPLKKACPPIETLLSTQESSDFSPIKKPEPPPKAKTVPKKPPVPEVKKPSSPATKKQSPKPKAVRRKKSVSPAKKMTTPQHQMQAPPSSVPSTGRKSNDSGTSQDFHLHYTSESEVSRSPSPFVPQHHSSAIATSTPHPIKMQLKQVAESLKTLTPNSKKKEKRKFIMSEMFGGSPNSERDYQIDMEVTDDMRNDLEEQRAEPKQEKRKLTEEEWRQRERLRRDSFERSRKSPERSKLRHSPEYHRRLSPAERSRRPDERRWSPEDRRRSPERDRRRTPERERRRSPERERRRTPERERRRSPERERRRSPDDQERRRSPYDWERRRSPSGKERRRSPTESERRRYIEERRRSPEYRDRRRPIDERDKRQLRRSRSVERAAYPSSSRRSPVPSYRKKSPDRRSPSPYESHSRREYSDSPSREESRKYRKESRSISPGINGSSRSYSGRRNEERGKRKELSPMRPSHGDHFESRGQKSKNYDSFDKRGEKYDVRKGDHEFIGEEEKRIKGTRDLRKVIDKARTREVIPKKKTQVPVKRQVANVVPDEFSEEGEVESD